MNTTKTAFGVPGLIVEMEPQATDQTAKPRFMVVCTRESNIVTTQKQDSLGIFPSDSRAFPVPNEVEDKYQTNNSHRN